MSEPAEAWSPGIRDRVAMIRDEADKNPGMRVTNNPPEHPEVDLGVEPDGGLFIFLRCHRDDVITGSSSARVTISARPDGCLVTIQPPVTDWTAGSFLEEVFARLDEGQEPGGVADAALSRWGDLLAKPAGPRLGSTQLAGLYGELEILERILRSGGSLDSWTGWQMDSVDFRLPGLSIEVKSTVSADYRRVRIHGLGQLTDPLDGSRLVLVLRRLELSATGRSVPELIDALVALGADRPSLLESLYEVGYSEAHREDYLDRRFVSEVVALRDIDPQHPRLTMEMVRATDLQAIDRVDYVLNLNGTETGDIDIGLNELIGQHSGTT